MNKLNKSCRFESLIQVLNKPFSNMSSSKNSEISMDKNDIEMILKKHNEVRKMLFDEFQRNSEDGFCCLCDPTEDVATRVMNFSVIQKYLSIKEDGEVKNHMISKSVETDLIDYSCFMKLVCADDPIEMLSSMIKFRTPKTEETEDLSSYILSDANDSLYFNSFSYDV
ncbi:TPA_asm: protein 3 [Leucanthemum virus 1]|uniref:Protein 3 n=1 Tax=Leucanthemum virus 1 TaxID=2977970 RepID=A0A9N7AB34_9RHAB|nr:TPA_asm: protein 3 [Leucanthemum virus 1]